MATRLTVMALSCAVCLATATTAKSHLTCAEFQLGHKDSEDLRVSTYHVTQVPGTFRTLPLTWPRDYRFPLSGRPLGVHEGPERTMSFQLSLSDKSPAKSGFFTWESTDKDKISVSIKAVDAYPLQSRLGAIAGQPRDLRTLQKSRSSGTTYHTSDGYEQTGHDLPHGWRGVAYPEPWNENFKDDFYWARFDVNGDISGILECHPPGDRAICTAYFWVEPVFIDTRFSWTQLNNLNDIEKRATEFVTCLISAGQAEPAN